MQGRHHHIDAAGGFDLGSEDDLGDVGSGAVRVRDVEAGKKVGGDARIDVAPEALRVIAEAEVDLHAQRA